MTLRATALAATAALALSVVAPAPSYAATTTIGASSLVDSGAQPVDGATGYTGVQTATSDNAYDVPAGGGVITGFVHRAGAAGGDLTFLVVRRVPGSSRSFTVRASVTAPVAARSRVVVPVRVPVQPGDLLGLSSATVALVFDTGSARDTVAAAYTNPPVGGEVTAPLPNDIGGGRLDVAAVVESDADKDGYGDDTQDRCATDARTQAPCPETTLTKRPKKVVKTTKRKAKATFGFSQPDPAGTFQCYVDGRAIGACTSPYTGKFRKGKRTFQVTAVNSAGVADLTPVVVTFKVKRKR